MITKQEIDKYIEAYNKGEPLISDEEFDNILEEYINGDESKRPFTRMKQSESVNDIVGTLPKVYGVKTPMRKDQKVYTDWKRLNHIEDNISVCVQPKFDGCSVAKDCKTGRYFTRGDYDNGESVDVTELFEHHKDFSASLGSMIISCKYEAIISDERFKELNVNNKYKRARDMVSATLTSRNKELSKYITLVPLRVYTSDHKQIIPDELEQLSSYFNSDSYDEIQTFIDDLLNDNARVSHLSGNYDEHFAVDGVVVSVVNIFSEYNIPYVYGPEVAIKILNIVKQTKLLNVIYQFGKSGRITPVAIVEPVMFDNITVSNITLSTFDRVVEMNLKRNDTVNVMYNIVPYLVSSEHDGDVPIPIPNKCTICGSKFDMSTLGIIRCQNPDCSGRKLGAIIRYCEKMKMFGISSGKLTRLYDEEIVLSIPDLYTINSLYVSKLSGFGDSSADNIIKAVEASSKDVLMHRWFGAFPMNDIGSRTWENILMLFENDPAFILKFLDNNDKDTFIKIITQNVINKTITNIGDITLVKIIDGLHRNWDDMCLVSKYLSFKKPKQLQLTNTNSNNKINVTLTGTRDGLVIEYLLEKGYNVCDFKKSTNVLIVPNHNYQSGKVVKAKEMNIPIYDIDEVYKNL